MKKLIVLLFLFISTPALAETDKHTRIFVKVSDIVKIFNQPYYQYQNMVYWYDANVMIVCEIALKGYDECWMDRTLTELKSLPKKHSRIQRILLLI